MKVCRSPFAALALLPLLGSPALADGFENVTAPNFADIEPRMVYGVLKYDVNFAGNGPNTRGESAKKFLDRMIKSKFSNDSGNYIVTLEVAIDGKTVVNEPVIAANWDKQKFLFVTTSSSETLVVNRAGVLLDGIVVDNVSNRLSLSMKMLHSKNSSVDMSLFKQMSDLSQSAAVAAFAPGVATVSNALQPFTAILEKLLSSYKHEEIVEKTVGAFTLLDEGLPNQLRFSNSLLSVNLYLQTENSQLPRNFDAAAKRFKDTSPDAVLATVASGAGAARATVFDIILQDTDQGNDALKSFLNGILKAQPPAGGFATAIRAQCAALKQRLNKMVTTRDTSLVYWAFLKNYGPEIRKYADGKTCADAAMSESLVKLGLEPGAEWTQP